MQLLASLRENGTFEISCPGCDSLLTTIREQDKRVHIMLHPAAHCRWSNQKLRVDLLSGYAEPWPAAEKESSCDSTEDTTRTSTITSEKTPCTTSRRVTPHTPRDIRAGAPGRTRR